MYRLLIALALLSTVSHGLPTNAATRTATEAYVTNKLAQGLASKVSTTDATYTATVARASSAYGWGDHAAAGYLVSSSWLSWLGTNTYVKVESDPTVPAHVKAITSEQVTNWDSSTGQVAVAYDNTRLVSIDSNYFVRVSQTNLVLYEIVSSLIQDEDFVKIEVREDLYGDTEIWPGNPILVNAGTYYAPVTFTGDYVFALATNSSAGISWSVEGVVDSPLSSFFTQGGCSTYFTDSAGVSYYGYIFPLSAAGFVNYEDDVSINMGDAYKNVFYTNAIIATFVRDRDLLDYMKTNHIGNVDISGQLRAGTIISIGDTSSGTFTLDGVTIATWPTGGGSDYIAATPIENVVGGTVITNVWTQSERMFSASSSVVCSVTNVIAALNANCTTNYRAIFSYNATDTNALTVTWDPRIEWIGGTPELTVTGRYEFAMSTACGTRIQARQTYPTVYGWKLWPTAGVIASLAAATNATATLIAFEYDDYVYGEVYVKGNVGGYGKIYEVTSPANANGTASLKIVASGTITEAGSKVAFVDRTSKADWFYNAATSTHQYNVRKVGTDNTTPMFLFARTRKANEEEVRLYNAGKRDF